MEWTEVAFHALKTILLLGILKVVLTFIIALIISNK